MKYEICILLSETPSEVSLKVHDYIMTHASEDVCSYISILDCLMGKDDLRFSDIVESKEQPLSFTSQIYGKQWELERSFYVKKKDLKTQFSDFVQKLWSARINQNRRSREKLGFCFLVPLYKKENWILLQNLVDIIKETLNDVDIDIVGFANDLVDCIEPDNVQKWIENRETICKETKEVIASIVKYKKQNPFNISHFVVLQDRTNTVAVQFNLDTLVSVIAEFTQACVEGYIQIFGGRNDGTIYDLQGIGLSIINFDRYYFLEYLIQNAFLKIIDNEKVLEEKEVSLTLLADVIDKLLSGFRHIFSEFYNKEVVCLANEGKSITEIIPQIESKLKDTFEELNKQIVDNIIKNDKWTMPQKQGLLSVLLGQDDEIFDSGQLVNATQTVLMDLESESLQFFISENNALLQEEETKDQCILPPYTLDKSQEEKKVAKLPIDEIKRLRVKERNYIADIRKAQALIAELEDSVRQIDESKKCLIQGGNVIFGTHTYKLLPKVDEKPLQNNYVAHAVSARALDLTSKFAAIRDQGQQGACLACSISSVFEYFLMQNQQSLSLSPQFLYYIARDKEGKTDLDEGSCLNYAMDALVEIGLCEESKWVYSPEKYNVKPDQAAYDDAALRKVKEALNVAPTCADIKSALYDGYPVIGSFMLCESFGNTQNGFVQYPTESEITALKESEENHRHAMVFVGYNDEQRVFKVRNSWSVEWGERGYCYIPYAYIENKDLFNWAAIIKEIAVATEVTENVTMQTTNNIFTIKLSDRPQLNFAQDDSNVKYALRKNALRNLEIELQELLNRDAELHRYYAELVDPILKRENRDILLNAAIKRRDIEITNTAKEIDELNEERVNAVAAYKRHTIIFGSFFTLGLLLMSVLLFLIDYKEWFDFGSFEFPHWPWMVCSGITLLFAVLFFIIRIKLRKDLEHRYTILIKDKLKLKKDLEAEKEEITVRVHLAGHVVSELYHLSVQSTNYLSAIKHYILNLREWHQQTILEHAQLKSLPKGPFVPLIQNEVLDEYFTEKQNELVGAIRLWRFIENYEPSEEGIVMVQQNLKKELIITLSEYIKDFTISDYLRSMDSKILFPYLTHNNSDIATLIEDMDARSEIFAYFGNNKGPCIPIKTMFIYAENEGGENDVQDIITETLDANMSLVHTQSKNKILLFKVQNLDHSQLKLA